MSEHSPEPWSYEYDEDRRRYVIYDATECTEIAEKSREMCSDEVVAGIEVDFRRIIACANACKGIPTEVLESGDAVVSQQVCSHARLETDVTIDGKAYTFIRGFVESHDCEVCRKLTREIE